MVREATLDDILQIVQMLQSFSKQIDIECAERALSPRKASLIVQASIVLGLCFVSLEGDEETLSGVILGTQQVNVWSETVSELNLLAIYVKPEYRAGSSGGRLLLEYNNRCEEIMANDSNVLASWVQLQGDTNIADNSMIKLGYKPLDRKFIKE